MAGFLLCAFWRYIYSITACLPRSRGFAENVLTFDKFKRWKEDRRVFPTRWLTYQRRLKDDLEYLYNQKGGADFFDEDFLKTLETTIRQLEGWQIKIYSAQFAILSFFALTIFSNDTSLSLFGVSFKNSSGIKEILLIIVTTLSLLVFVITSMKDLRIAVVEKLVLMKTDKRFVDFAQVAYGNSFSHSSVYNQAI